MGDRLAFVFDLFDDDAVRKKLTVLSKWDAMTDDGRNADGEDMAERLEAMLRLGRRYRVTVEDAGPAGEAERAERREAEAAWLRAENERLRAELEALRADGDVPPWSQAAQQKGEGS